jgi:hypothetical protein
LGKWLSNLAVLIALVAVLALAGIVLQFWKGESTQINLAAYLAPYLFIALPFLGFIAACAVLFEAIPVLQGGFGNIVYFMAFIISIPLSMENLTGKFAVFEPLGIGILQQDMGVIVRTVYPNYDGAFSFGPAEEVFNTFTWTGVHWTPNLIMARLSFIGLAILLTLIAALFFDRFDTSRSKPKRKKGTVPYPDKIVTAPSPALASVHLTPLAASANRFSFFNVLLAELKLLIKGQRWWWYAIAGILIIVCFASPSGTTRQIILPLAWVWPVLVWSAIGSREIHNNVQQMTFSSASPLWRQLPAQWLAGFIVTLLVGIGAVLRFLIDRDTTGLLALLSGAIFIPSLALASGVWSGTSKLFEILYISIWYIGPLNKGLPLDFIGANNNGRPEFFLPVSIVLIVFAFLGRMRQVRN